MGERGQTKASGWAQFFRGSHLRGAGLCVCLQDKAGLLLPPKPTWAGSLDQLIQCAHSTSFSFSSSSFSSSFLLFLHYYLFLFLFILLFLFFLSPLSLFPLLFLSLPLFLLLPLLPTVSFSCSSSCLRSVLFRHSELRLWPTQLGVGRTLSLGVGHACISSSGGGWGYFCRVIHSIAP